MLELTVFIIVRTPNLKDFSNSILKIVNNKVIENSEIIKIMIVKKYLFISDLSVLDFINDILLKYICLGFEWDRRLFIENLNKVKTFITRRPELVEKKEPPIITKIININDKLLGTLLKEIPIFETLLEIDTRIFKKLLSELKNTNTTDITINK